jgi:hypothetical protein
MILVQLDDQNRLQLTAGRPVITLDTQTLRASRRDPSAGVKAFRPLILALEQAAKDKSIVLFDIGATQVPAFIAVAALAELDEDLVEAGFQSILLAPALAEPESLRQTTETIQSFRRVLPSFRTVFVENRRDGAIADLPPGSEGARIIETNIKALIASGSSIVMPPIEGASWRYFEQHSCRPIDVVGMEISQIVEMTGLNRTEAKIARADVAAWLGAMQESLNPILGTGSAQ